jgi:acyl-coenzyme A synthetase/AMP-(fatty) acid ligase
MWLWEWLAANRTLPSACLHGVDATIPLQALERASLLGDRLEQLRGRSVVLALRDPLTAALALIELDGVARRMVLCPPDLSPKHAPAVIEAAEGEVWLNDRVGPAHALEELQVQGLLPMHGAVTRRYSHATEWVLLSSGTTGVPKLVVHTLSSLCAALQESSYDVTASVWSTFYDIRRYGGLQILLRALRCGALLLHGLQESISDFLARAARAQVTHVTGTPSHWRAALMSGAAATIAPRYVRLSGEIADQGILDRLRSAYPNAQLVHAFASTEAGVVFEVSDGRAGFSADLLSNQRAAVGLQPGVELKIEDQTLRVRSPGNARGYLGTTSAPLTDREGFVDTGDRLELREGRCYFVGRAGGIINVGGLKVHPEEVEAVINSHPRVRVSRVIARRNPITGAVVVAEIVPADALEERPADEILKREVLELCRERLPAHKVPAAIQIVERLELSAAGKLVRADA